MPGVIGFFVAAVLAACVDYAGPPPEQETDSNQPSTNPPPANPPPSNPPPSNPPADDPAGDDDVVSFDRDVHPILLEKCGMCHEGVAPALPDHGAADVDVAFEATQTMSNDEPVYMRILERASGDDPSGFMPPNCAGSLGAMGCLTQEEYDIIELWVEQGASNR